MLIICTYKPLPSTQCQYSSWSCLLSKSLFWSTEPSAFHLLLLPNLDRELYSYLFASCSSRHTNPCLCFESYYISLSFCLENPSLEFSHYSRRALYYIKNSSFKTLYEILTLFHILSGILFSQTVFFSS